MVDGSPGIEKITITFYTLSTYGSGNHGMMMMTK
jgi:hypothetical protein